MRNLLPVLLLALCLAVPTVAQAPASAVSAEWKKSVVAARDSAIAGTRAFEWTASLVNEVGTRFAGSPGDPKAVAWGVAKMKELGFENVRAETARVPRWVRGEAEARVLAPEGLTPPAPFAVAALGGSPATPVKGLEAEVIEVASLDAIDALPKEAVAGKIVFYSTRMQRTPDGSGYGAAVGIRGQGVVKAAAKGAVAVIIRSVGTDGAHRTHTGSAQTFPGGLPPIPCAALGALDAEELQRWIAQTPQDGATSGSPPVRMLLRLTTRLEPDVDSANVVGEVRGREVPGEIVLLACHLDSWDLGQGAEDDGAGCGIVLETARRIATMSPRPRRTVRVVLYANEEFGLSGARAYGEAHAAEFANHMLAAESDLGSGKILTFRSRVKAEALPVIAEIAELLQPLGIAAGNNEAFGGADLIPLVAGGVPVVELHPDASKYFDVHHTPEDTIDKVDAKGLDHAVASHLVVTLIAAETGATFGPIEAPQRNRR